MHMIPSDPVKTALRRTEPHRPSLLEDFAALLADRLPEGTMAPSAFVLQARVLQYERPGRLAGFPPVVWASLEMALPALALEALPPDAAEEAVQMFEATR